MLQQKHILLGITGGIAVYRIAELARTLIKQGAHVRCIMTASACAFVSPLTFEALTGESVHTELFNLTHEREMGHIQLARWADVVLIAPATCNVLAKISHGIADDLLTTMIQVCKQPILIAPAMNPSMWQSQATQDNITTLRQRGIHILPPASGILACGEHGAGRLPDLHIIVDTLIPLLQASYLQGQRWVINAGPTVESWDAVRTLSNRASGTLGACLARVAAAWGADVCLIAGVGTPSTPEYIQRVVVKTGLEMLAACEKHAANSDVFIATAAVSDFRFTHVATEKIKRGDTSSLHVELTANPDIVAHIAHMPERPHQVIAFAAETQQHIAHAQDKLQRKGVDAIVANDVSNMGQSTSSGWWVTPQHVTALTASDKTPFAMQIIQSIMELT
ncbi:MAG: bifunctional phosphopantothenoylcysteine decarboxylase/phosphopantothenate--cysteine ligase CoaBC [Mariprofundaceae bacterium]|nr:bifunctional phosphopantothenoylcysteine decarboxylase/phosphopantothenate--cysteine ligase CoaBC [Mariprofundaceae bacterium]